MTQAFNLGLLANNVNSSGKLDGTTGLTTSVVANTIGSAASTALTLQSAGTTAVTIDTSQNVGIGTTPYTKLQVTGTIKVATGNAQGILSLGDGGGSSVNCGVYRGSAGAPTTDGNYLNLGGYDGIVFTTGNSVVASQTERMRILSTGQTLIDRTSNTASGKLEVYGDSDGTFNPMTLIQGAAGSTSRTSLNFHRVSAGASVGSITTTNTATAYGTSSDYRLKEDIAPMTGALAKVAQLKPVTYKWKIDGADGEGFIAHELAEVCPHAVSGEKDATREQEYEVTPAVKDEEGNITTPAVMGTRTVPVYQGIDTSFLVATLTAAIQELSAKNDALTARIVALEAK
jgi:hypothetical protein